MVRKHSRALVNSTIVQYQK